jgi:hypothetical protein
MDKNYRLYDFKGLWMTMDDGSEHRAKNAKRMGMAAGNVERAAVT